MTYPQLLKNLEARGFFRIKPGLARMQQVARALGYPERRWAALHIAGTNGKGSVSATLESILRQAGYKTGLYTSPHLVSLTERIQINGSLIPAVRFAIYGTRILALEKRLSTQLTYFEFLTALAFLYFCEENINVGIIECGMGGRWDATNIIPRPAVSVITSIGLDHMAWLGNTVSAIAREKAGIIKEDSRTVSGVGSGVESVLYRQAQIHHSDFFVLKKDFRGTPLYSDWPHSLQKWEYRSASSKKKIITTSLMGLHQVDNGALTLKAVELLQDQGWSISEKAITLGFKGVKWPGRLQVFQRPGWPRVLLDGAHNPHAISRLLRTLNEPTFKKGRVSFIFSAYNDKDIVTMAHQIGPVAERVYLCELPGERRATLRVLAEAFAEYRTKLVLCARGIAQAVTRARDEARISDCIVATGSLMLVGEILKRNRVLNG